MTSFFKDVFYWRITEKKGADVSWDISDWNMKELASKYDHHSVEEGKYDQWVSKGYFTAGDKAKQPFTIVIPPPNVTGKLHLGHAWDTTLQDIIARYKRMQGFDMLWLPGMDHAGIATQAKVDARLREEGLVPRQMDRQEWMKRAWQWKEEYSENIHQQWAKMGLSVDYTRERFTLDEGLNQAVRKVFVDLYNQGLIYRGERIINWDPALMTALSNEEVEYSEDEGAFYHLKYMLSDGSGQYLEVATTRPETLFGDTAVAVHPKDERYNHLIGRTVLLPVVGKEIPIVADEHADPQFGTGVVKITPAHDPNDFEVGQRHDLPRVVCMNADATMNENAGKYAGMDRYACRKALVKDLEAEGILIQIEKMVHSVGHSQRSGVQIEPYLSRQWFVKMRPLADRVLENQKDSDHKVNFYPQRFEKTMNHWMEITYDWCISRQLWWGHRIPAWYRGDEVYVGMEAPEGEGWIQDTDVLDTWFSSALWPFSTLGWPEKTEDFARYYPNDVLVTGYDIIPFWVNRMTFQGLHFTDQRPFRDVLIHGLIRDAQGRKMSKSLGNGVDPMDVIDQYGVDALRFFLTTNSTPGMDIRYIPEKVEAAWNFINKIWNASRFVLMNLEELGDTALAAKENRSAADEWILSRLNEVLERTAENMDKYEFAIVGNELYSFVWDDFCSWYLEMSKANLNSDDAGRRAASRKTLLYCLSAILRILHPFMPFVTEEIYQALPCTEESICVSEWPVPLNETYGSLVEATEFAISAIKKIREIKMENHLKPNAPLHVMLKQHSGERYDLVPSLLAIIEKMAKVEVTSDPDRECSVYPISGGIISIPSDELQNKEEELRKLQEQKIMLEAEIKRSTGMLSNPGFISKAPEAKIQSERNKLEDYQSRLNTVLARIAELG